MKTQLHHILIVACIASTAIVSSSFAQDAGVSDYEVSDNDRDKILASPGGEGESRYKTPSTSITTSHTKDSITTAARVASPVVAPRPKQEQNQKTTDKQSSPKGVQPKEDNDSILSFNFLYYIIEKYKLQDIVD